jgi:hypothetical protein
MKEFWNKWVLSFYYDNDDFDVDDGTMPGPILKSLDMFLADLGRDSIKIINVKKNPPSIYQISDSLSEIEFSEIAFHNDSLREFWFIYCPKMFQNTDAAYEQQWHHIQDATEGISITAFGPIDKKNESFVIQSFDGKEMDEEGYFEYPDHDENYQSFKDFPAYVQKALSIKIF